MLHLLLLVGMISQCTAQTYNFSYKDPVTCDWIQCETNDNSILSVFQINTTNSNEYIDHAVPVDNCVYTQVLTPCDCPSVNESFYTRVITSGTCSFENNSKIPHDVIPHEDCGCPEPEPEPEPRDCEGHLVNQTCSGGEKHELFIITTDAVNGGECSYTNETLVNTYYDCPRDCVGHLVNQTCSGGEKHELFIITTDAVNGGECSYTNETLVNTYYDCPVSCVAQYVNQSCIDGHQNEIYIIQTLGANGGVECLYENETVVNTHDCTQDCVGHLVNQTCIDGHQDEIYVIQTLGANGGAECLYDNETVVNTYHCSGDDCIDSFLTDTVCNGHGNYVSESKSCVCDTGYDGTYCCSCADGYTEPHETPGTCVYDNSPQNCVGSWGNYGTCANDNVATFDGETYEACEGAGVTVNFNGNHNVCEEDTADEWGKSKPSYVCQNERHGFETDTEKSGILIGAAPGQTRYFRCSSHPEYKFKIFCPSDRSTIKKQRTFNVTVAAVNGGTCPAADGAVDSQTCTSGCKTGTYDNIDSALDVHIQSMCTCGRGRGANDGFTGCESCAAENAEYNNDDASAYNEKCSTVSCGAGKHAVAATGFFAGLFSDYTCVPCDDGHYSPQGSGQCSRCDGIVSADGDSCTPCETGYAVFKNRCMKQQFANSITTKRTKIKNKVVIGNGVTPEVRDAALVNFDNIIKATQDKSKSQTAANNIRTVEITVTQDQKDDIKLLAKSDKGNGALVRRSLFEAAKSEVGSGEDAVVKMDKTDFEEMFITDVDGTSKAADILNKVVSVEMRTVKPKGEILTCGNDADIHMEGVASNTLSEVLLENVDDMSLKCLKGQFETKLTLISVEPDIFKAECYDGVTWQTVNSTLSHYDTYECNDNTHLVMSDTWTPPINPICVEVGQRVLMHDGTHKNVEHLVPGDMLRTPDGTTTVRGTRRGGRHLSSVHDVECAGKKGSITGNHAYHCEGEWRLPQDTHGPRALEGVTEVVAIETDNYCEDRMILESGLEVETWDGRGIDEWRPHTFENGRRLRCTLKGTWRDRVLQRVDSRQ